MDELGGAITSWGVPLGLIIWVIYWAVQIATKSVPQIVEARSKRKADQQEHIQKTETDQKQTERLLALANAGSRTFMEDQQTLFLSETFTEAQTANEFLRRVVSDRLDIIDQRTELAGRHAAELPEISRHLDEIKSKLQSLKTLMEHYEKAISVLKAKNNKQADQSDQNST